MRMKKIAAVFAAGMFVFAFAACEDEAKTPTPSQAVEALQSLEAEEIAQAKEEIRAEASGSKAEIKEEIKEAVESIKAEIEPEIETIESAAP